MQKQVLTILTAPPVHWVGDGFPVRSLFSYSSQDLPLSPFLLLDYVGPIAFAPSPGRRGVAEHPHRGIETVTIVYKGSVEHRDSSGGGGVIGPGDVQWMTAGCGILHEELHAQDLSANGGELEMVQLWVNLPARHKMMPPGYQAISADDIALVDLADGAGWIRVIAGNFADCSGAARTMSPLDLWDLRLYPGKAGQFHVPEGHSLLIVLLHGVVRVNEHEMLRDAQVAVMSTTGSEFRVQADSDARLLILSGEPLDEPVVGHGPFVMNTQQEIRQAIDDFNSGRFAQTP